MKRQSDALEKLAYADARFQELAGRIHQGGLDEEGVKYIGLMAGDILASVREVYDYLAADIGEKYAGNAKAPKKLYYPFYETQLGPSSFFAGISNRALYDELCEIAKSIKNNDPYPGTSFQFNDITEMAAMVNQKKHDKILRISEEAHGSLYHQSGDGSVSIMLNLSDQKGIGKIVLPESGKTKLGNQYIFQENRKDVMMFCMKCKGITKLVVDRIYGKM